MSLSLAMIVLNVEKTIRRCLEGFKQCVDEIVIVDTGSTDNTLHIVKEYTDKIYHFKWIDDFSAARNYSFEQCTKDHIIWVDGDDYILPEDIKRIKDLDLSDKEIVIFNYAYAHDEFGKPSMIVPRERIIKRSLGLKWQEKIHEYISIEKSKTFIAYDIMTHHDKQHGTSERNLSILERVVQTDPSKSRNLYYLGKEYMDFGRTDDAIEYLSRFTRCNDAYYEDVSQAYQKLALCFLNKGNEYGFRSNILKALEIEDGWAEPYYHMGLYYMNKQQWYKAIQWFEVCTHLNRNKNLLSSYQPEYYSWLPQLNLCLCYNNVGDIQKAYECNKRVLEVRPGDTRAISNDRILFAALKKPKEYRDGQGKKLNIGCGGKRIEGYIGVDLFKADTVDEIFEMDEIPYKDNTISAIYSEHALEHVPFERAEKTLREWCRVLRPGGELQLYMPDFENCCRSYLNAPLENPVFMKTRAWYKFTVYGIQRSQAGESDEAQIHKCGFSKEEIRIVVERNGFIVNSVENYGGPGQKPDYGTPSMVVRAVKPDLKPVIKSVEQVSNIKIGWVCPENWEAAQSRIRVLRVNDWLKSQGYISSVINYDKAMEYDIIIIGKSFSEYDYNCIKNLKQQNKAIYADLCEDLIGWPYVNEILSICDKVVCCSDVLAEKVQSINSNVEIIEDAWEFK